MNGAVVQKIWTAAVYLFLFLPIVAVTVMSINASKYSIYPAPAWTLDWYKKALSDDMILEALLNSSLIALAASLIATMIGTLVAVALIRFHFRYRESLRSFFMLPLIVPEIIIAISLLSLSTTLDLQGGYPIMIAAHVLISLPFVITVVSARLYGLDSSLEDAARDLGANEYQTFQRITLPLALPGVIAGLLLSFTISFDNFLVSFMVSGSDVVTIPLKIYSMLRFEFSPKIHAASTLIILFTVVLLLVYHLLTRKDAMQS